MQTLKQKLEEKRKLYANNDKAYTEEWCAREENDDCMPEVLQYNKLYRETYPDKYPYNDAIKEFICEKENIPYIHSNSDDMSNLSYYLGAEIYISQHAIDNEKKREKEKELQAQGFLPAQNPAYRGKAILKGTNTLDWISASYELEGKIIDSNTPDKTAFFLPKGKRNKGYFLRDHFEGYYKPLTK